MADAEQPKPKAARPNSGIFRVNPKKLQDPNSRQPDWRGTVVDVNGKEWLASIWERVINGDRILSLSLTDPATLPPRTGVPAPDAASANVPAANPAAPPPATVQSPSQPVKPSVPGNPVINPTFGDIFDNL